MIEDDPETIRVFTDGSCDNRSRKGGWAFCARFRGARASRYGHQFEVTSNKMELEAIYRALLFIPASPKATRPLVIYCDSAYAIAAVTEWYVAWRENGWRTSTGSPVANKGLVRKIVALIAHHRQFRELSIVKVKGHAGIVGNEHVDILAGNARKRKLRKWDKTEDIRNRLDREDGA